MITASPATILSLVLKWSLCLSFRFVCHHPSRTCLAYWKIINLLKATIDARQNRIYYLQPSLFDILIPSTREEIANDKTPASSVNFLNSSYLKFRVHPFIFLNCTHKIKGHWHMHPPHAQAGPSHHEKTITNKISVTECRLDGKSQRAKCGTVVLLNVYFFLSLCACHVRAYLQIMHL